MEEHQVCVLYLEEHLACVFYLEEPLVCDFFCVCRLKELETFASRVSEAHALFSGQDRSTHLYDPVNAFQVVNRYSNKWLQLHSNLYTDNSKGNLFLIFISVGGEGILGQPPLYETSRLLSISVVLVGNLTIL